MFAEITINEFQEIIELFKRDSDGTDNVVSINMGRLFITGMENELMLRFNVVTKTITIARVQFKHTRIGMGTALIELLKEYAKVNDYSYLVLESVLTEEGHQFALKQGFQKELTGFPELDEKIYGNYKLVL